MVGFKGCRLCALGLDAVFAVSLLPRSSRRLPKAAEKEKPRRPVWREMTGRGHGLVAQPTAGHVHAGEARLSHWCRPDGRSGSEDTEKVAETPRILVKERQGSGLMSQDGVTQAVSCHDTAEDAEPSGLGPEWAPTIATLSPWAR